jgi:endogenous inhibitor of DNA gyrase (YacG/DUF329 family)
MRNAASRRRTDMSLIRCPICERQFDFEKSPARPFCGERCRNIDLARWLGEKYSVPTHRREDEIEDDAPEQEE